MSDELSASEALFGFGAWLTQRTERSGPFSRQDFMAPMTDLIAEFCDINHLAPPREDWLNRWQMPPDLPIKERDELDMSA